MRYKWNESDIRKDISKIEKVLKEDKTSNKGYYSKIIDDTNSSIMQGYLSELCLTQTKNNTMFDIADNYYQNKRYYSLIEILENEMRVQYNTNSLFEEAFNKLDKREYFTHEDTFTIVHDFYKNLDDELFQKILLLYNNRYKTIRFRRDVEKVNNMESDGYCIFIDYLMKNYITIRSEYGIQKLLNLAHECGHGIMNLLNPNSYTYRIDDYSSEIITLFIEQVFCYETLNKINAFDTAYINIEKLNDFSNMAYYLGCHKNLIDAWNKNNNKINYNFYRNIRKSINLSRDEVEEAMCTSITDDGIYVIAYMVSLELFNLYKKDKNSSIELIKRINSSLPCDTLCLLEKYIQNFSHLKEEIDIINDDMCKQLVKKVEI